MRSVRVFPSLPSAREVVSPVIVRFTPPAPLIRTTPPPAADRAGPARRTEDTQPPAAVPRTLEPAIAQPIATAPPTVTRDSANVSAEELRRRLTEIKPTRDLTAPPPVAPSTVKGAPMAPAGVTRSWALLTDAQRDSIEQVKARALAAMMARGMSRERTEEEKRRLTAQAEPGAALPGSRAAGAAPLMNGGSQVRVPIVSIPAPIFTRKPLPPEPAEARRLRLLLAERAKAKRDSLRADSIAKAQIRP